MDPIVILFGTESGNTQGLAKRASEVIAKAGLTAKVIDMLDFDAPDISSLRTVLIITSTYGNGDPPSNAEKLHAFLMKKSPPLPALRFSVCGLGDTTYDRFAQCGKDFDVRLGELGAERILERQDCDVDYDEDFEGWLARVIPKLSVEASAPQIEIPEPRPSQPTPHEKEPLGSRRNPIRCRVVENRVLTAQGSTKETRHVELAFDPVSGFTYEPGDSVGVFVENDAALVDEVLSIAGLDASSEVERGGTKARLGDLLRRELDVVRPDMRLADTLLGGGSSLTEKKQFLEQKQLIDCLRERAHTWTAAAFCDLLRPLAPRPYSIASSLRARPSSIDLTVAVVRYELGGKLRKGVASTFLAERAPVGTELQLYLHAAPHFRLAPADRPLVMIGPGTGVAPFRAFLEEREATGARGKAWLFFGDRHRATDFLYETDWRRFQASGVLTDVFAAFSRDQTGKVYVQHRMHEHAKKIYAAIEEGGHVYVCGDAHRMAPDVEAALIEVIAVSGGVSREAARSRVAILADSGRYQRDVY